ncbi:MAG: O-antigen ligase family protein [Candidatus Hydrogenedentes bacterium]|nr:O-antigen ligase family protein [Candidatus Hydrogenedentota bacterium]
MSRRRKTQAPSTTPAAPGGLWPESFASPRNALLAGFCVAGWTVILTVLGFGNNLLGLKQAGVLLAGARLEPVLMAESLHSLDIAAVLVGFVLVLGAGYVHVSLGLAVLLALRPWLDGYVYEADNLYFLWGALLLSGIWAVRQFSKPRRLHGLVPLGVLFVFWVVSAVAAATGIQYDSAYHQLLLWAGYAVVFFLAAQVSGEAASRRVFLAGFLVGLAGQALYAYPYLHYLLPFLRRQMLENPAYLASHFGGITEATPEIARRLNLNRASASMIYPNALAALLILGIPACLALTWNGVMATRASGEEALAKETRFRVLIPWGLAIFVALAVPPFLMGQLALIYALDGPPWFGGQESLAAGCVAFAGAGLAAFLFGARRHGLRRASLAAGALGCAVLVPVALGALWITYSRGAMLALAMAVTATGGLVLARRREWRLPGVGGAAIAIVLIMGLLVSLSRAAGPGIAAAQEATAPEETAPGAGLRDEGIDVTFSDLANPASLSIRLTYWRVALRMALDNPLLGVGPGNFKFAYPVYQYLGAGDVQNAHNGFLQAWCETGILGAVALAGFWIAVLWPGVVSFARSPGGRPDWLAAGLVAGILAFLLHAMLDMNLTHPTLMTFAMAAAGLLARRAPRRDEAALASFSVARAGALAVLMIAALFSGLALRPYLQYLATNGGKYVQVGDRDMLQRRFNAAAFFLADGADWARAGKPGRPPALPAREAVAILGDRDALFRLGSLLAPVPETGNFARLAPESAIPPQTVFQLERPWDAHLFVFERARAWLGEMERIDARFPADPDHAVQIARGYKLLLEQIGVKQQGQRDAIRAALEGWSGEAVRRNPLRADLIQFRGWALWACGAATAGETSLNYFKTAIAAFEQCTQLAPNEPNYHFAYREALDAIGESYARAGDVETGERYRGLAKAADAEGRRIQRMRGAFGLP